MFKLRKYGIQMGFVFLNNYTDVSKNWLQDTPSETQNTLCKDF